MTKGNNGGGIHDAKSCHLDWIDTHVFFTSRVRRSCRWRTGGRGHDDLVRLDHLAEIYFQLGQREQAVETWRKSVQALEKSDEQGKIEDVRKKLAAAEKQPN